MNASKTETATDVAFELTPPDPVPVVAPEKAAGLVPVDQETKTKLATKVDGFVAELLAEDTNSPEFGKKVDQLTNMGRKEIMAAAQMSNRFLDRPIRAMDKDEGVGANLSELRRVVEELDPGKKGKLSGTRKILGIIPFGNKLTNYFRSYQSAQTHIQGILTNLSSGRTRCNRSGQSESRPRDCAVLHAPANSGFAHPNGGQRAGLSGA